MTNNTNTSYVTFAQTAIDCWTKADKQTDKANQHAIYALFKAHFEVELPDNVTIDQWLTINGSVEKARMNAYTDALMTIFGFEGKFNANTNPEGWTNTDKARVFNILPTAISLIEMGEDSCIFSNGKLKVRNEIIEPDNEDDKENIVSITGESRKGRTVANINRNAKRMLGLTTTTSDNTNGSHAQVSKDSDTAMPAKKEAILRAAKTILQRTDLGELSKGELREYYEIAQLIVCELDDNTIDDLRNPNFDSDALAA